MLKLVKFWFIHSSSFSVLEVQFELLINTLLPRRKREVSREKYRAVRKGMRRKSGKLSPAAAWHQCNTARRASAARASFGIVGIGGIAL